MPTATQTVTLGQTNITVPALGIGTWAWGDNLFWSYGKDYGAEQVQAAFSTAVAQGVTFFDTAELYGFGESERLLGQFMQQTDQPIQIATKYFPLPWRFSAQSVTEALNASLKRLQVNQIALYQVHTPFDFLMGQKVLMNALADAVQQGKIGAIGVSNYSAKQMRQAHQLLADRGIPLAVNQVRYSLLTRQIESNGTLEAARELGVTILAYSPLAQGLLTGKYTVDHSAPIMGGRRLDPRFSHSGLAKIAPLITALRKIGELHQRTPAQVALNWLMAQGQVIPIPGAKTAEQAQQNAGALGWSLSRSEIDQLAELSRAWK
ncbi:aldo/keto reductase [Pantanalinema sp. GBBB05]|uniref:aldo/keto reductase n=1 Tax=Pantanalinema sp. GBBB05 TaxID=2604139 RepID=UPI001DD95F07|nr:aldo/keto reductase [Pantanalinema sp. GBBB05]